MNRAKSNVVMFYDLIFLPNELICDISFLSVSVHQEECGLALLCFAHRKEKVR